MDEIDGSGHELAALMEAVQVALCGGNYAALPQLTLRIRAAETGLHRVSPEDLAHIQQLAARNARSLIAASRGIKAAHRRIAEVMSAARGLVTYDRLGHRVEVDGTSRPARRL